MILKRTFHLDNRGQAMTMVLMAVAVSGVFIAAMSLMITNAQRDVESLSEKVDIMNMQSALFGVMSNEDVCRCNFDPAINKAGSNILNFNSNAVTPETKLSVGSLYGGCKSGVLESPVVQVGQPLAENAALKVESVRLENILPNGAVGAYTADLKIQVDSKNTIISRRPATVAINFETDTSNPANVKITKCVASAAKIVSHNEDGSAPCTTKPSGYYGQWSGDPVPNGTYFNGPQVGQANCTGQVSWICLNGQWSGKQTGAIGCM